MRFRWVDLKLLKWAVEPYNTDGTCYWSFVSNVSINHTKTDKRWKKRHKIKEKALKMTIYDSLKRHRYPLTRL